MTGLAPEIPEDLYMLIKKVASFSLCSVPSIKKRIDADEC